jgi:hypothetical protein
VLEDIPTVYFTVMVSSLLDLNDVVEEIHEVCAGHLINRITLHPTSSLELVRLST